MRSDPRVLRIAYHAIHPTWESQLAIPEASLRAQLLALRDAGYTGLTFSESERRAREGTLPPRSVVVTFDDGYESVLAAEPVLAEAGFPATVFVVTRFVESGAVMEWFGVGHEPPECMHPLGWAALERLLERGWEVGSHTVSHPLLTLLDDASLDQELRQSRELIEARLGGCSSLSYPYGIADRRVASAARRAGYETACTLTGVHTSDTPLRRPRIGLNAADTGLRLQLHLGAGLRLRRSRGAQLVRVLRRSRPWVPAG